MMIIGTIAIIVVFVYSVVLTIRVSSRVDRIMHVMHITKEGDVEFFGTVTANTGSKKNKTYKS